MYCEEPIINVWYLEGRGDGETGWDFPDYLFGMNYYVAGKSGLVFQTEHYYITVNSNGVKRYGSKDEFVTPDIDMYNYDDWYEEISEDNDDDEYEGNYEKEDTILTEEALYFIGEHIRNVTEKPDGWLVEFDHFSLGVHPRTEAKQPWSSYYDFLPFLNLDHKLKRCECGGKARLMVDRHEDYYICCDSCFRSTYADYRLGIVVKHWNSGQLPVNEDHTPFESFLMKIDQPIRLLLLDHRLKKPEPNHYICNEPLLQFDGESCKLTCLFIPDHRCIFNMEGYITSYNPQFWPVRIAPEAGEEYFHFVSLVRDGDHDVMTLTTGKRGIIFTAMQYSIDIRITNANRNTDLEQEKGP